MRDRAQGELRNLESLEIRVDVPARLAREIDHTLDRFIVTGRVRAFDVGTEPKEIGQKLYVNSVALQARKIKTPRAARPR